LLMLVLNGLWEISRYSRDRKPEQKDKLSVTYANKK